MGSATGAGVATGGVFGTCFGLGCEKDWPDRAAISAARKTRSLMFLGVVLINFAFRLYFRLINSSFCAMEFSRSILF